MDALQPLYRVVVPDSLAMAVHRYGRRMRHLISTANCRRRRTCCRVARKNITLVGHSHGGVVALHPDIANPCRIFSLPSLLNAGMRRSPAVITLTYVV